MSIYDAPVKTLEGAPASLKDHEGEAILFVNVASKCGLTPQYTALEAIHEKYKDRGFTVIGVPSNQFRGQEPGTAEEIREFCSTTYGVTFPILEKTDVNGAQTHPLYQELKETADSEGNAGDVMWNFEKFLVAPGGKVVARFRPQITPDDATVIAAIEGILPK
jgi:glutathione peroxidase